MEIVAGEGEEVGVGILDAERGVYSIMPSLRTPYELVTDALYRSTFSCFSGRSPRTFLKYNISASDLIGSRLFLSKAEQLQNKVVYSTHSCP